MPICSYIVIPEPGTAERVEARLSDLSGCRVARAENRDLLLLVTETPGLDEENALRKTVEELDGIQALLLTFGEIDPETDVGDPVSVGRRRERRGRPLPVADEEAGP